MILRRSELFVLTWSVPKERIAEACGVSGPAVGGACKRYDVPTPGRGYWRKIQVGETTAIPALPVGPNRRTSLEIDDALYAELTKDARAAREAAAAVQIGTQPARVAVTRNSLEPGLDVPPLGGRQAERLAGGSAGKCEAPFNRERPVADDIERILKFAYQLRQRDDLKKLLEELEQVSQLHDPPTAAVLAAWKSVAREGLAKVDPTGQILSECRAIAKGELSPDWWVKWR